ncbi:glucuronide uptake porin UidC [Vibrio gazogenes]|uniref:Putative glucuronide porin n=1 Tax=Vibrio gazogenes DSM 21264 = NBRC 103151 TaxID=1123492 RepID=A0A1M4TX70_VIBGA|nr:glucuronide uptake porin UidC [Vibrio gazogenes]USP16181.1 glucuronide uptake porin UidC [Vibrio gazogenes]SHE49006.1 putative glucuronide porin [Vibrio gazogenes DSM 21264] [Vibrio gazogenes DSM 21264 = NBRC 103151]SJN53069.1 Membrane-associated protein UidC precursor [Vibrio gazogenes]
MKRLFIPTLSAVIVAMLSTSVFASESDNNADSLRLRLKNDFRKAERPSAGPSGQDIYAWVQGTMVDLDTHYFSDFVGVTGSAYYVYKLGADGSSSTRGYLRGYDSFSLTQGALKFKLNDDLKLKVGRFGTDSGYGSLPYDVPLISSGSNRTMPTLSEGALVHYDLNENVELWGMWRQRVFLWTDVGTGVRDEGVFDSSTGTYSKKEPRAFLAGSWHDDQNRVDLGYSWQDDVSSQVELKLQRKDSFDDQSNIRYEFLTLNASLSGLSKAASYHNDTQVYSGKITYTNADISYFGGLGYVSHVLNGIGTNVNTDIGYVGSLSIDRNKEDMYSLQIGVNYTINNNFSVMVAPLMTDGYEDTRRTISIKGKGVVAAVFYKVNSGPLTGLRAFVASDVANEKRSGSALGDDLDYWDIKAGIQYDFNL